MAVSHLYLLSCSEVLSAEDPVYSSEVLRAQISASLTSSSVSMTSPDSSQ